MQNRISQPVLGLGVLLILLTVISSLILPLADVKAEDVLKGGVSQGNHVPVAPTVNQNDLKEIDKGNPIEMTVATSLSTGVSENGDEFFGKVTRDYTIDGQVVIPRDTLVHGTVQSMAGPRYAGRNAYITTRFDYLITPDGREIPINGGYTNKDGTMKAAAKVVGRSAGFTAIGGVIGAVTVLRYGGLAAVTASNGYALAGGAAIGGAVGLGAAMLTKGHNVSIPPGAELKVRLQEKLVLPSVTMPSISQNDTQLSGLDVKVLGTRIDKDPFGEVTELTLTLDMTNHTKNTFSFFDIALEDENGSVFFASPLGDTGLWFQRLEPNTHLTGNLSFSVDNPKKRHTLVFYKQYTREPVTRIALTTQMQVEKHNTILKGRTLNSGIRPN